MNHILVVDDDDRIRNLLKDYLAENHYIVSTAENADQAKERLQYLKFDIIILDVMMPGMTGYEVTQRVRQTWPLHQLPIMMLTAKNRVSDLVIGLEAGANDYLSKPFHKKELLARIKTPV